MGVFLIKRYTSGGGVSDDLSVITENTTATDEDEAFVMDLSSSAFTLTLPAASTNEGKVYFVKKSDTSVNIGTIARTGSDTFYENGATATSTSLDTVDESIILISDGVSKWYVYERRNKTQWTSYTPTLSWTANIATNAAKWRRVGDSVEVMGYIKTSDTTTGVNLTITIPNSSSWTIDTAKLPVATADKVHLGTNNLLDTGDSWWGPGFVGYNSTTSVILFNSRNTAIGKAMAISNTTPFTFAANDEVHYRFTVPISGWKA